jgi:hypothetical protein
MASKSRNVTPPTTRPAAPRATSPAVSPAAMNNAKTSIRPAPDEDQIRVRAYSLWEEAGRPEGDGMQFWLVAEQELGYGR